MRMIRAHKLPFLSLQELEGYAAEVEEHHEQLIQVLGKARANEQDCLNGKPPAQQLGPNAVESNEGFGRV